MLHSRCAELYSLKNVSCFPGCYTLGFMLFLSLPSSPVSMLKSCSAFEDYLNCHLCMKAVLITPNLSDFSSTLYHCIRTLFGSCILYYWSLKAGKMSYSKFYSLQLLYNILHYTMLRIYLQVEWIDTTDILLTYLLQCDYSGEEGWENKQVQGDQLVLLGPLLV